MLGEAHLLAGHPDQARTLFVEASTAAQTFGNFDNIVICEAHLAWLAMDRSDWQEAAGRLERALAVINEYQMHDYVYAIPAFAGQPGFPCITVT